MLTSFNFNNFFFVYFFKIYFEIFKSYGWYVNKAAIFNFNLKFFFIFYCRYSEVKL